MNYILLTGLWGGLLTVLGAAYPEEKVKHPLHSTKNWLLGIGALILTGYAFLNYLFADGSFFFVLLEMLVIVASIMMMADLRDAVDAIVLSIAGAIFVVWSLFLYEGFQTIYFIVGLTGIALGYAFKMGTIKRAFALTLGSGLIAYFSYLTKTPVFLWLNVFFCLFSAYYLTRAIIRR